MADTCLHDCVMCKKIRFWESCCFVLKLDHCFSWVWCGRRWIMSCSFGLQIVLFPSFWYKSSGWDLVINLLYFSSLRPLLIVEINYARPTFRLFHTWLDVVKEFIHQGRNFVFWLKSILYNLSHSPIHIHSYERFCLSCFYVSAFCH